MLSAEGELIVLAVVVLAAGILGGRELWMYEHPEIECYQIQPWKMVHRSEDLYGMVLSHQENLGDAPFAADPTSDRGMRSSMVRNCGSIGKQPMRFLCGSVNSIGNRYMSLRM